MEESDLIQFELEDSTKIRFIGDDTEYVTYDRDPDTSKELLGEIESQAKKLGATISKNASSSSRTIKAYGGGLDSQTFQTVSFALTSAAGITFFLSIRDFFLKWAEKNPSRRITIKKGETTITIDGEEDYTKIVQLLSSDNNTTSSSKSTIQLQAQQIFFNSHVQQKEATMGDNINVSGGQLTGTSIGGHNNTMTNTFGSITNTITSLQNAADTDKEELNRLVQQLNTILQKAPAERQEDAEAVAEATKDLVDKAAKEKPNKTLIGITGEGLKAAAQNIEAVLPGVLAIATQIVTFVLKFAG